VKDQEVVGEDRDLDPKINLWASRLAATTPPVVDDTITHHGVGPGARTHGTKALVVAGTTETANTHRGFPQKSGKNRVATSATNVTAPPHIAPMVATIKAETRAETISRIHILPP
jgi:hypothetical protein